MQTQQIIGVRELLKNFSKISSKVEKGEDFLVLKNSKPLCKIISPNLRPENIKTKISNKKTNFNIMDFCGIIKVKDKDNFDYKKVRANYLIEKYLK